MRIINYQELVKIDIPTHNIRGRKLLLELFDEAVNAVDPFLILKRRMKVNSRTKVITVDNSTFNLSGTKIWVIGAGKAVGRMTESLEKLFKEFEIAGIICVPEGVKKTLNLSRIVARESSHPIPTKKSVKNTQEMLKIIKKIKPEDFVIGLISGGGSALWTAPISPIPVEEIEDLNYQLLRSGMSIHDINVIRKHVSQIKGGKLAKLIPSRGIILVISDVIGDKFESIASGPFYPDNSTYHDVNNLIQKYELRIEERLPDINLVIKTGLKKEDKNFQPKVIEDERKFTHYLLGSNKIAREAIIEKVNKLNLKIFTRKELVNLDARDFGRKCFRLLLKYSETHSVPVIYLSGGEPIVKVEGEGTGGRNQEVVGAFLSEMCTSKTLLDGTFLSAGTDGVDGNSIFAGAICDSYTCETMKSLGINIKEYQMKNNLTGFFEQVDQSLIFTGPTNTNVMDIQLLLINNRLLEEKLNLQ
ncbi:MAG: glycerate kinase type-2 family protein [Candidatus Hodarchaeales archaeon]|jgi:glycerate-2-kinase